MFPATPTWEGHAPGAWVDHVMTPQNDQATHYPALEIPSYIRVNEVHPSWLQPVVQATYTTPVYYEGLHPRVPVTQYQTSMGHRIQSPDIHGMYSYVPPLNHLAVQPFDYSRGYGGYDGLPPPYHYDPHVYHLEQFTQPTPIASAPAPLQSLKRPKAPKMKIQKDKLRKIKAESKKYEVQLDKVKKEVE